MCYSFGRFVEEKYKFAFFDAAISFVHPVLGFFPHANTISPMCSTLLGMLTISFVCVLPFLSPVLGPGAVIAQIVGTLLVAQFATKAIPAQYSLPASFAINAQVGCDFIPVGLSLAECDSKTIEFGIPSVLYSRVLTGPLSVEIAYIASIGLYQ